MLIFLLLSLVASKDLKESNKELREINRMLRSRLFSITEDPMSIKQEYLYNKEKLQVFINQYQTASEPEIKFAMLEAISYYCESISENFQILGEFEGVSSDFLNSLIADLQKTIQTHKNFIYSKDLAYKHNKAKQKIEEKDKELYQIQQENSVLLGKLTTSEAELRDLDLKYSQIHERILKTESDLDTLYINYNKNVENLKTTLQSTSIDSLQKEKQNFETIQTSQDLVISSLQAQSEQLALKIQQISAENSGLSSKINIYSNNINRLEADLENKNNKLLHSESKYEEFRRDVSENAKRELENLREAEKMYMSEISEFDKEISEYTDTLQVCDGKTETIMVTNRQAANKIEELGAELRNTIERGGNAKKSRQIEVEYIEQKINSSFEAQKILEEQLKNAETKIVEQNSLINTIKQSISDEEYSSKRKKTSE